LSSFFYIVSDAVGSFPELFDFIMSLAPPVHPSLILLIDGPIQIEILVRFEFEVD